MPSLQPPEKVLTEIFETQGVALRRTAYLLCGDWHHAEDLVQVAFAKTFAAWSRMKHHDSVEGYLRQTMTRAFLDETRRKWRGETPTEILPEVVAITSSSTEDRILIQQALSQVPPKQRACLVLRFFEDLTVAQTAAILSCTQGTVKSNTARGLETLREALLPLEITSYA